MANAHVIGLGKSGMAAARLLKQQGWQVTASDRGQSEALQQLQLQLQHEGIEGLLGYSFNPETIDTDSRPSLIVISPGVPWDMSALIRARELGIETIGEMELAWRALQDCPWVGVTGTNGKTTTTALTAAIFQAAGWHAPACGNIGYAACELALSQPKPDCLIAEFSSYLVEASNSIAPKMGIWTTFTPDHLSRHGTLERYFKIKAQLLNQAETQIFNGDDPYLRQNCATQWPNAFWTSIDGKDELASAKVDPDKVSTYIEAEWVIDRGERIVPVAALQMVGTHNQQNLLMAVAAARLAGIDKDAIAQAIRTFPGVPHRLERICTWQGIDFINDSKATNYDAAQVGLAAVSAPAILIAGGEAKAGDDSQWLSTIQTKAAVVLLIGDAAPTFAKRLAEMGYTSWEIVETMERAVSRSAVLAQQLSAPVVLLSPACASFDCYQNFEQRGDHFRQLCLEQSKTEIQK